MTDHMNAVKTAVISSPSHSVRVMIQDGETMFAARDVLAACGIKHPDKWIRRNEDRFEVEKLRYPLETGCGMRRIMMLFVGRECGRMIVASTACPAETKRWLLTEVFTYGAGKAAQDGDQKPVKRATVGMDAIGRMVDNAMIELLEIKKYIAEAGAAG